MTMNSARAVWIGALALSCSTMAIAATPAAAQSQMRAFDIPAQSLSSALLEFSRQADILVVVAPELTAGKHSQAIKGTMSPDQAVRLLLRGTQLQPAVNPGGGYRIERVSAVAVADADADEDASGVNPDVVVTGTHIRNAAIASPVLRIDNQQMREAGQRDLGDVIRDIPSNYNGGQNPGARFQAGTAANTNSSGSSALDLRGLGPDATLTLLNGRRLPYDGDSQAIDVSAIPLDAVQEIQIVPDGASALYGSDAVAGVANIILRRDYDGLTTSAQLGAATDGGGFLQQYDVTGGKRWGSGGILVAVQFDHQNAVRADQRDYTQYVVEPNTLLDAHKHVGALVTAHQNITDTLTFSVDALYSWRHSDGAEYSEPGISATTRYSNANFTISPTLTWSLPGDWTATLNGSYGRNDTHRFDDYIDQSTGENDGSETFYKNYAFGTELNLEGRLFSLPGGDVRLAVGGGYRFNHLRAYQPGFDMGSGGIGDYYGFGELSVPLVSQANAMPLIHELSLSAALRHEEYDRFGGVSTPKLGLIYAPAPDFDIKFSWGRSFKAPTLDNEYTPFDVELQPAAAFGGGSYPAGSTVLLTGGGNPDLGPERARTWSTTLDLHPRVASGLNVSVTYFNVDYTNRVTQPISNGALGALDNPAVAEFVDYDPTAAQQAAVIARDAEGLRNYLGVPYDPAKVVAIINNTLINAARQRIHGVDLNGSYKIPISSGDIIVSGQGSWLTSSQRNSLTSPSFQLAGTNFNPPRFRARAGVTGHFGRITTAVFANYIGPILNENETPPTPGTDMTTIDLSLMWKAPDTSGTLKGVELGLFVQNLTNARPPYLAPFDDTSVNYDSTNYSPLGRFISVSLRKAW
jgi:outer membrane receptor protein involved in Fe transport